MAGIIVLKCIFYDLYMYIQMNEKIKNKSWYINILSDGM